MGLRRGLAKIGPLGGALTAGQLLWALRRHWLAVPSGQRERLLALVAKSKGRPANLSDSERSELRVLVRELHLLHVVRESAIDAVVARRQIRRST